MKHAIVAADSAHVDLEPMPIRTEWMRGGSPEARGKLLVTAPDKLSQIWVWECTPGEFEWHFTDGEETSYIQRGEVFIRIDDRTERRLGPGDVVVFPAHSRAHWRITAPIRKIAVVRRPLPPPLGIAVRASHKLLRTLHKAAFRPAALVPGRVI